MLLYDDLVGRAPIRRMLKFKEGMETKVLIYTFRSFPWLSQLRCCAYNLVVFGALKTDFEKFKKQVEIGKFNVILGLARATGNVSLIETFAVNRFNSNGRVSKKGVERYPLFVPSTLPRSCVIHRTSTASFCNWTMYKISELIESRPATRHVFVHIQEEDLGEVIQMVRGIAEEEQFDLR